MFFSAFIFVLNCNIVSLIFNIFSVLLRLWFIWFLGVLIGFHGSVFFGNNFSVIFLFRGHLKSPWSRRRRKHVLTPQQWRSLFTSDGKLRDGGIKLLKKVRSGVSCLVSLLIGRTVLTPFKYKIIKALFYFVIKYSCKKM